MDISDAKDFLKKRKEYLKCSLDRKYRFIKRCAGVVGVLEINRVNKEIKRIREEINIIKNQLKNLELSGEIL